MWGTIGNQTVVAAQHVKFANLKGNQFNLLRDLGKAVVNFWQRDPWKKLEDMNIKINVAWWTHTITHVKELWPLKSAG